MFKIKLSIIKIVKFCKNKLQNFCIKMQIQLSILRTTCLEHFTNSLLCIMNSLLFEIFRVCTCFQLFRDCIDIHETRNTIHETQRFRVLTSQL